MNKKNKILVGCLALLLVMSAGYALFSDTITINGTATAKGNFDILATCQSGIPDEFPTTNLAPFFSGTPNLAVDNNFKNDSCAVTADDEITLNVELTQPGSARNFLVELKNNGSIPAVIDPENGGITVDMKRCEGNFDDDSFSNCVTEITGSNLIDFDFIGAKKSDGTKVYFTQDNGDEISKYVDFDTVKITIQPGESLYVRLTAEWQMDNDNEFGDGNSVYYKDNLNVKFIFNQVTN